MPSVRKKRITSWLMAFAVIGFTALLIAIRPSPEEQQAACIKQCLPRQGTWAPDPDEAARDTSRRGTPAICTCH